MAKIRRLLLKCLFAGALSSSLLCGLDERALAADAYHWTNAPIEGGGFVTGILYHPTVRGLVYLRTDTGGVYRWDPASHVWSPLLDFLGRDLYLLRSALSIAIDPADADQLYVAAGWSLQEWAHKAAIFRSHDRGATWDIVNLPFRLGGDEDGRGAGERLQVDPLNGSILFLGTTQDGLWRSADSGGNWSRVEGFPAKNVTFVQFDPHGGTKDTPTRTLYAGTEDGGILRSNDAGQSWSSLTGIPAGMIARHAAIDGAGTLFVTLANGLGPDNITAGGVWKCDAAANLWTDMTPVKPGAQGVWDVFGYGGIALDMQHPGTLLVSTLDRLGAGDDLFRSTDGGRHWVALGSRATHDFLEAPWAKAMNAGPQNMGTRIETLAIDPFDSNNAIYGTGYGVWQTADLANADGPGSTDWSFADKGLENASVLELISPPKGPHLLSALAMISGFRHDDPTAGAPKLFEPFGDDNDGLDYAAVAPDIMVRTRKTENGFIGYRSVDGGASWTAFAQSPLAPKRKWMQGGKIALSADGGRILWIPPEASPYLSTNDGQSWTRVGGGPFKTSDLLIPVADRVNPARFMIEDKTAGYIYTSTDGGATFTPVIQLPGDAEWAHGVVRAVPGHEGDVWAPVNDGLLRSTDGGVHFVQNQKVQQAFTIGFGKAATDDGYPAIYLWGVVGGIEGIFRSTDEGHRWTRINDDRHRFADIAVIAGDPRIADRVYLGTNGRGIIVGDADR